MSKFTKPADIARQSGQSQYDRPKDFCPGCGYRRYVHGAHPPDCTRLLAQAPAPFVITMTIDQVLEGIASR